MQTLFLIIAILVAAVLWLKFYDLKKQRILGSALVRVNGAEWRYPQLPLHNYGVPIQIKEFDRLQVVFPRLTADGDVEYLYSWHRLADAEIVELANGEQPEPKLKAALDLAPIVREHLQIEPEIALLGQQYRKVNNLADLVATSQIYRDHLDIYERAVTQVEGLMTKAEELEKIYIHLIREALIGLQIAGFDPNAIPDRRLEFDAQYQRVRDEFQQMKDTATAYADLMQLRE